MTFITYYESRLDAIRAYAFMNGVSLEKAEEQIDRAVEELRRQCVKCGKLTATRTLRGEHSQFKIDVNYLTFD